MKYVNRQQSIIIHEQDATTFQIKLNKALDALSGGGIKYELEFHTELGFCAFILTSENIRVPENKADLYILNGERFSCSDCPHYVPTRDKRTKWSVCERGTQVKATDEVCPWYYKSLDRGTIDVPDRMKEDEVKSACYREVWVG